jgi:4'-phosphopantetheinyl transferase
VLGGEVHVWRADLDAPSPPADRLPAGERARAAPLAGRARTRWLASRWFLREVLSGYLGEAPERIRFRLGEWGKPNLAERGEELRFNLSHSGNVMLLAVCEREVGVDVERIDPRRDVARLASRALDPAAAAAVHEAPAAERTLAFHRAWARHEAIAKCHGTGLRRPRRAAHVAVSPLDAGDGFAAALAVAGERVPPLRSLVAQPVAGRHPGPT